MMKILQFSDTHVALDHHFDANAFRKGMRLVGNHPYDIAVHVGDITQHGYEPEYRLARELIDLPKTKYLLGNHDARNVGYTLFDTYFGETIQAFKNEHFAFGFFDSTIPDRNEGRIGKTDIRLLKEFLDEHSDRFTVVSFHHHLLPVPRSGRERGLMIDAGNVLKVILDYRADLVLSAHRHSYNVYKVEDTTVVNSGTFSSIKTRAGDDHSFNYLICRPEKSVTVKRVDIESETENEEMRPRRVSCLVPATERKARIVHISDTHFGGGEFRKEAYDSACKKIIDLRPDFVVHAGDVTDDGLSESYIKAKEELDKIPVPKMVVPGMRDYKYLGEELFETYFPSADHKLHDINLIWADSVKFDESEGNIGRRQLRKILKRVIPGMVNVVVFHHHIVPVPHTRENNVLEDAGDVLKALTGKVNLILNGSKHVSFSCMVDGTVIANSNTLSSKKVHARYGNTFNVIDILKNNSIVIREVGVRTGVKRILGVYSSSCHMPMDAIRTP